MPVSTCRSITCGPGFVTRTAPKRDYRARSDLELRAGSARSCGIERVTDDVPTARGGIGGHGEGQRFPPRVDEEQEVVIEQWCAVGVDVGIR